jgi:hypothetical protein
MELLGDLLKILLPAALVVYAVYLIVRSLTSKEYEKRMGELKIKSREIAFPLRLQAYERVILFLERITLPNILARVNKKGMNSLQLYNQLLFDIRDEYNHNLSQQVYISDQAWNLITNSKEQTIAFINKSFSGFEPSQDSVVFAKVLLDKLIAERMDFTGEAITFVKNEIRELY